MSQLPAPMFRNHTWDLPWTSINNNHNNSLTTSSGIQSHHMFHISIFISIINCLANRGIPMKAFPTIVINHLHIFVMKSHYMDQSRCIIGHISRIVNVKVRSKWVFVQIKHITTNHNWNKQFILYISYLNR